VARKAISAKVAGVKALRKRLGSQALGPLTRDMHQRMIAIWQIAGEAFIRAAMTQVLIETGMSAASFFPLSRAINLPGAAAIVDAKLATKKKESLKPIKKFPSGKPGPGRRSIASGKRVGKDAFLFSFGSPAAPVLTFQFVTLVFQLAFHEPSRNAVKTGFNAFKIIVKRDLRPVFGITLRRHLTLRKGARRVLGAKAQSVTGRL
jgi:hypothetical protein